MQGFHRISKYFFAFENTPELASVLSKLRKEMEYPIQTFLTDLINKAKMQQEIRELEMTLKDGKLSGNVRLETTEGKRGYDACTPKLKWVSRGSVPRRRPSVASDVISV